MDDVIALAQDLVRIDSRSFVSNIAVAARIGQALPGFEIERLDYTDGAGVAKCVMVACRGVGGLAFSGHMDTVPDTGWTDDPWSARLEGGRLHGLGSADMKGPIAAFIVAAQGLPANVPVSLLITTDEETTKQGAMVLAQRSALVRAARPVGIVVAEPTGLVPVRGHRAHVSYTITSVGVQAHSATGLGRNANWALPGFLVEMKALHDRLRTDAAFHDHAYTPVFSDFNLVIDNHGAAVNVTVPRATVRIKYRYSASMNPDIVTALVRDAADRAGLELVIATEGSPPELALDHPLIRMAQTLSGKPATTVPFGTDASQLQAIAPCVIIGPGDIGDAHKPTESIETATLPAAVDLYRRMALAVAAQG